MAEAEILSPGIHLVTASSANLAAVIDGIVHLHAGCVMHDSTLATFVAPLSHAQITQWWEARVAEVGERRQIIVYVSRVADRSVSGSDAPAAPWEKEDGKKWPVLPRAAGTSSSSSRTDDQEDALEVSGIVSLETPFSQTGPFRAIVQKLFVHPLHRRRGIARKIMARLETIAVAQGRWNLMLDTSMGSGAESVYPRLGYERLGVVREYGYDPNTGDFVDEVFFWKDLRKMKRLEEEE